LPCMQVANRIAKLNKTTRFRLRKYAKNAQSYSTTTKKIYEKITSNKITNQNYSTANKKLY
jgi:hypothetical protein